VSSGYDAIVIGAGPNGLTTAGSLARVGRKVLVVERRATTGGLAAGAEFHPGHRSPGIHHDTTRVGERVIRELELERYGLKVRAARPGILALDGDGSGLWIDGDRDRASREIGARSPGDAASYLKFHGFIDRMRAVISQFMDEPPVKLMEVEAMGPMALARRALKVRGLGRKGMMELLRLPSMSVADWLGEWFETDLLKAALALPAIAGNWAGPRSPATNANLLLWEAVAGNGVEGDGPALISALEKAARARGVEIRLSTPVSRILSSTTTVEGVELESGEKIRAGVVAASCDPRLALMGLLPQGTLPVRTVHRLEAYRMRGSTGQVLLALNGPLRFKARPDEKVECARTGARLNHLERAFDAIKYRRIPDNPVLEIHAPAGTPPVVSILVHFLPFDLDGGWDDATRDRVGDRVMEILEEHAPGIGPMTVARKVLSPADVEKEYGVTGGHIHHGELALDQILIRPVPECCAYATPIAGLFLCGSGTHPGGGLTCTPGRLAASAILSATSASR
jgi:phytoene dehydrogenase-like protein